MSERMLFHRLGQHRDQVDDLAAVEPHRRRRDGDRRDRRAVVPRTAMPSATTPRSLSWKLVPKPCRRTMASIRFRAPIPAGSSASSGCSRATSSNGRSASRTFPPEVSRAASRTPTRLPTRSAFLDSMVSMNWMSAPGPDHQVAGLPGLLGQPDQVRPGDAQQRGGGIAAAAQVGQGAARPVRAVPRLLDETAEPEHRDEPVRGRTGDAELGRRLAHPEARHPASGSAAAAARSRRTGSDRAVHDSP